MNRKLNLVLMLGLSLFISACASNKKEGPVVDQSGLSPIDVDDSNLWGTGMSASELAALGITGNPLNYKVLYFEYNSTAIDRRSEIIALAHAREIGRTGVSAVTLDGHADERGTRDFNLALGERRAMAVSSLMMGGGAGNTNIRTISYGEERPVDTSHNEAAWQANRRVEISY